MGNVESSGDSDTQQGSDDINTSGDFEEFMDKEDLTSKILDKITTLKCLNTKFNRKRLVKKRTRDEVAYLHAGITHMIDIYQEFVDPGLPKKKNKILTWVDCCYSSQNKVWMWGLRPLG